MKVDRVKVIVDGLTLLIGLLLAVSVGAFSQTYQFTPFELTAAGVLAGGVARLLLAYVATQPAAAADLSEALGSVAKTSELVQVLNLLSGTQKTQIDMIMNKLNSMVHPIVLDPANAPTPAADQAASPVAVNH